LVAIRPYLIHAAPYRWYSGGEKARHLLCHRLRGLGVEAYLVGPGATNPDWDTPVREPTVTDSRRSIHVLADVNPHAPHHAERVVWWVLQEIGHIHNQFGTCWDGHLEPWQRAYVYSAMYRKGLADDTPVLTMPTCYERHLFNSRELPAKHGGCWYAGHKGASLAGRWHGRTLLPEIWMHGETLKLASREATAVYLRAHDYLLAIDPISHLAIEATLCGCMVKQVLSWFSREQWELHEYGTAGIAFGTVVEHGEAITFNFPADDIERARATLPEAEENYDKAEELAKQQLEAFVQVTQEDWE